MKALSTADGVVKYEDEKIIIDMSQLLTDAYDDLTESQQRYLMVSLMQEVNEAVQAAYQRKITDYPLA